MPVKIVFHEIYALSWDRMGYDNDRLFFDCLGHVTGINNRIDVITINLKDVPTKCFPFARRFPTTVVSQKNA